MRSSSLSPAARATLAVASLLLVAACSSSKSSKTTGGTDTGTGTTLGANAALQVAQAATTKAEAGTYSDVDPTSRPAAKGKSVIVVSASQASISSQIPADGAAEAARKLGWKVSIYDAKLNPAQYAPLVRQAIAAKPDGIILVAIDCQTVRQPLQEAKNAGIKVVPVYAFDCNDPHAGGDATGLFSGVPNFGARGANIPAFTESYGADQANYIVAASQNKAKIIVVQDPEFTVLYYTYTGFKKVIDASGGSKIVSTLDITTSDITSGKLLTKIQAEILKHPEADWIKTPYTYVTTLGLVPALGAKAGKLHVMGGEGFAPELDLIRQGKVTAVNNISSTWNGWAAADTLNSIFLGKAPVPSGIGWQIADKDHNLPPKAGSDLEPKVDFKAEYAKAWGVG